MEKIDFYRHQLGAEEIASITETLGSIFLTTGPKTAEFETRFAEFLGTRHVLGVTSCTSALFLCLEALEIGHGDEVITSPMSFIATSNAVIHAGATPVFVDVEPLTGNLDPEKVESAITPRTKAIIPVHLYGAMADMAALRQIADRHHVKLIEDAAHASEASRDGARPGQVGDAACFSFYATKNLTCGEGGAIATSDDDLAEKLRLLRLHGMSKTAYDRYTARYRHYDMPCMGYKANMNDLQASLLLPQLPKVETKRARRGAICQLYQQLLRDVPNVRFPIVEDGSVSAHHLFTVWVPADRRDAILNGMMDANVGVAVNYRPIHLMTYYRERFGFSGGEFPEAERIGAETITLPLYPTLSDDEVRQVVQRLAAVVR